MVKLRNIVGRLFGRGNDGVIGLDIGPSSIKVIVLSRIGENIKISGGGKVEISQYAMGPDGSKSDSTVEAICKCIDLCGCRANRAICAVDAPDVAVRSFTFDPMPPEDTGYSILMEAEHISPTDMDHTVVDYQLVGGYEEGKEIKGMLAAARSDAILDKCHLAEKANLQTVLVDVDSLALINCFSRFSNSDRSEVTAIVNLGDSWTNLAVVGGERLPFVRNISYSGNEIVHTIANCCGLSESEVQSILFQGNTNHDKYSYVREIFLKRLSELVPEISDTLRYWQARERNCPVDHVLLCGDFAVFDGACEVFGDMLHQEVGLWNPVMVAGCSESVSNREELEMQGPSMAVAMGLSMRVL